MLKHLKNSDLPPCSIQFTLSQESVKLDLIKQCNLDAGKQLIYENIRI